MISAIDHYTQRKKISPALIKLLVISNGIAVDGNRLEREIEGYTTLYRVKRSKKRTKLVNGKLL